VIRQSEGLTSRFDWPLFIAGVLIALMGVVNLYSATSVYQGVVAERYISQLYWLLGAGVVGAALCAFDYRHIERGAYIAYAVGIFMLLIVFVLARDVRGSARWIEFGSFRFQPSEFTKVMLIVALAKYLHDDPKNEGRSLRDLAMPAAITAVPAILILRQPDLGTAMVHVFIFLTIAAVTKVSGKSILLFTGTAIIAAYVAYHFVLLDYQRARIEVFLNPEADLLGRGWHAHHARVAIGNGELLGNGYPQGDAEPVLVLARPGDRLSLPGLRRGVGVRRGAGAHRALLVPVPVVDSRGVAGAGSVRGDPVRGRDGDDLLARRHQHRHDLWPPAGGRRHAAAVLLRRQQREHRDARAGDGDERVHAAKHGPPRALLTVAVRALAS
jgi:hypothetical protein